MEFIVIMILVALCGFIIYAPTFIMIDRSQKIREKKKYKLSKSRFIFFRWKYISSSDIEMIKNRILDEENKNTICRLPFWMQLANYACYLIIILLEIIILFFINNDYILSFFLIWQMNIIFAYIGSLLVVPLLILIIESFLLSSYEKKKER